MATTWSRPKKEKLRAPSASRWFWENRQRTSGGAAAAVGLRRIPARAADPVGQAGIWIQHRLKRFNDPERPPIVKYEPSWEEASLRGMSAALSVADAHAAFEVLVSHYQGDGKDWPAQHRGSSGSRSTAITTGSCGSMPRTPGSAASEARPGGVNDRGAVICAAPTDAAAPARVACHRYDVGGLQPDGRTTELGGPGRCSISSPRSARKPAVPTRSPAPTRWCRSSCGMGAPSTCRKPSRGWGEGLHGGARHPQGRLAGAGQ